MLIKIEKGRDRTIKKGRTVIALGLLSLSIAGTTVFAQTTSGRVYEEKTPIVSYHWGTGGPNGLTDNFTAIFDQSQYLDKKDYFIQTYADDGVVVEVDGKKVINRPKYSYDSLIDKVHLTNLEAKNYQIKTTYYEGTGSAFVHSHIVPFGDWLAYYYNNTNFSGRPVATKIIKANENGDLVELNWQESPVPGVVNKDNFSATYSTDKRIPAGDYVINLGADDGAQVYIDGKLVLDRFTPAGYREDAVKVSIKNINGSDIHTIEVKYKEGILSSRVKFQMVPYSEFTNLTHDDGWFGEIYPKADFTGTPIIIGGNVLTDPIQELNLNWGLESPSPLIPNDNFSAIFKRKLKVDETNLYHLKVWADDKVRFYIDGKLVIDSWKYIPGSFREVYLPLEKGEHDIHVEYAEGTVNARIQVSLNPISPDYKKKIKDVSYYWGEGGPTPELKDNYTVQFDQSQTLKGGNYFVQTRADDGLVMIMDDKVIIDRWKWTSDLMDRVILKNVKAGDHRIITNYHEGTKAASVYSHIVPFGDWLAYYYNNTSFSGSPIASKVIPANEYDQLVELNWQDSPVPGVVNEDNFTAIYVTAKELPAGEYIVNLGADDGAQVYIDGKLVLDRFTPTGYREDSVKVTIKDNAGPDKTVHWIEVKYKEGILSSRVKFSIIPYEKMKTITPEDGWVGEIYPSTNFTGTPVIIPGNLFNSPIMNLNYDWGTAAPSPFIPADNFSTKFMRKYKITEAGYYVMRATADDGVRVYLNGEMIINSWKQETNPLREKRVYLEPGIYTVEVQHYDSKSTAKLSASLDKAETHYNGSGAQLRFNWGEGSPAESVQPDNFTATFNQSQYLNAGDYFIQTYADDGVIVKFNGTTVINRPKYDANNLINYAFLTNVKAGNQTIITDFFEGVGAANLFSEVVKFGDWLAYYYPNQTLTGSPIAAKVIPASGTYGQLFENNGEGSPVPGVVPENYFSARYTTAKRIQAGEYVLRTGADDGVQVYIDGQLVLDRFTNGGFREDSMKITISNRKNAKAGEENIHWIEVRYKEASQTSKVQVYLQPYNEAKNISTSDGWFGEFFPNKDLTGNSAIIGGKDPIIRIDNIDYYWGNDAPSPLGIIPEDNFSARFTKKMTVSANDAGYYYFKVTADDGVRLKLINSKGETQTVIDSWKYESGKVRESRVNLLAGEYTIVLEYYEGQLAASLKFEMTKLQNLVIYKEYNYTFDYIVDRQIRYGSPKSDNLGKIMASRPQVEYYLNPNNFDSNSANFFMFLKLNESAGLDAAEVNQKVLAGKGSLAGTGAAFIEAGRLYKINEAYLIAHTLHETGNGTSILAKGVPVDDKGKVIRDSKGNIDYNSPNIKHIVYNMYGYGAYDGSAIDGGAKYAFDRGWFTPELAIIGGAERIASGYINAGQDTLYKMKWNPDNPATHQYATHVSWALSQTSRIKSIYDSLTNYQLIFEVPKYLNQPAKSGSPTAIVTLEVLATDLNVRADHSSSSQSYGKVSKGAILTAVLDENYKPVRYNEWYKVYYQKGNEVIEAWVSSGTASDPYLREK